MNVTVLRRHTCGVCDNSLPMSSFVKSPCRGCHGIPCGPPNCRRERACLLRRCSAYSENRHYRQRQTGRRPDTMGESSVTRSVGDVDKEEDLTHMFIRSVHQDAMEYLSTYPCQRLIKRLVLENWKTPQSPSQLPPGARSREECPPITTSRDLSSPISNPARIQRHQDPRKQPAQTPLAIHAPSQTKPKHIADVPTQSQPR